MFDFVGYFIFINIVIYNRRDSDHNSREGRLVELQNDLVGTAHYIRSIEVFILVGL